MFANKSAVKKDVLKFIELYKSHEILWNMNLSTYRRNDLKMKAYETIAAETGMSVDEVKRKIKSIRTAYSAEKAKVVKSKKSGCEKDSIYTPNVFWYSQMAFLDAFLIQRNNVDNSSQEFTPEPKHSKQLLEEKRYDLLLRAVNSLESEKKDDIQILSDCWGSLYKKLDEQQQLYASKAIYEVLYQGALGNLTETSWRAFDKQPNFQSSSQPAASAPTSPCLQSPSTSISNHSDEPARISKPKQAPKYRIVRPVPTRLTVAKTSPETEEYLSVQELLEDHSYS